MGLSLVQSIDAVDAFSGLLVANGANAERGAAAMEALARSFQRDRVDAQAWMMIYSTADTIVGHLAKSSEKTAAEIRQMGVEGKISAEMMAKALVSAYESVIKQVEGMPTTVRDALTNLNTAFGEYIGWQNEASGATAALASGLRLLGENLSGVLNSGLVVGGPIVAITLATGLAATARLAFSKRTDEAKASLIDIGVPLDKTVKKFQALDAASRQLVINEQLKKQAEAADKATDAWKRLQSSTTRGVNEFGSAWSHGQWREFRRELESLLGQCLLC